MMLNIFVNRFRNSAMKKNIYLVCLLIFLIGCESAQDKADRFFLKGNVALGEGRNDEAIKMYDEAISKNPKLKEAYNNKGVALYREGKLEEAIEVYYDVLVNVDAYYIDAIRNRLDALVEANRFDDVARDIGILQEIYPDSAFVDMTKGLIAVKMQNYQLARRVFSRAYKKQPNNIEPLVNIANIFYLQTNFEWSSTMLDSAEKIDPSVHSIYNTRSMILTAEGKYDEALLQVNKALSMDSDNPYYLNNRGSTYIKMGELEKAKTDVNLSIQKDFYNGWAYRNKGILYNLENDYESAVRNFELAVKYNPGIQELHGNYGDALFQVGRKEDACSQWSISIEMFENDARESYDKYCK
jgi:tetratricopeptide (TPR) repeat protein